MPLKLICISILLLTFSCSSEDKSIIKNYESAFTYQRNMNEIAEKENQLMDLLSENNLDAILLHTRRNFAWITGGSDNHVGLGSEVGIATLYFGTDGKYVIMANNERSRILEEELNGLEYADITFNWFEPRKKQQVIKELINEKKVGSDWQFDGTENLEPKIAILRSKLDSYEIERYKWLCNETAQIVENTCHKINPGMTELQIQALVSGQLLERGINPVVLLIAVDDRIDDYKHAITKSAKLKKLAMVNIVAEKWGLNAAITRFVHFGKLDPERRENLDKVSQIYATILDNTEDSMSTDLFFKKVKDAYRVAEYPNEWKAHHIGGLIGYKGREYKVNDDTDMIMEVNQAFAWNPTLPGVKIEDTILLTEKQIINLTHTGNWVYKSIRTNKSTYEIPQILVR